MDLLLLFLALCLGVLLSVAFFLVRERGRLSSELKGAASEALRQSNETFLQLARATLERVQDRSLHELEKREQAVSDLVRPVREALDKFDGKIQELEKARTGAYVALREQVSSLQETERMLKTETTNLVKALRAPSVRGRWGEIQLKRVVELAGMLDHCDFYEQTTVQGDERRFRPDLLVRLPGGKQIVVDAKAPLEAYLEAIAAPTEEVRKAKMIDHARQVRNHVTLLSRKSYWEQFSPTPEFVVLFLPGETFFSAALEEDPSLIEVGVDQGVILATPTTLIALLRSVAYGWRQERISQNAEEISELGRELYKRLGDLGHHFGKLGKNLELAVEAYNKAVGSLETRVLVSARRFKDLESTTSETLDSLEPIDKTPRILQAAEFSESPAESGKL